MNLSTIQSVYFVGAGGIGMSALVRYFLSKGKTVAGYDRTPTPLTAELIAEGAAIHYEENIDLIPSACKDPQTTLVVLTPAVPKTHAELVYFEQNGFQVLKRAAVLGIITRASRALCVAGTHGKTTTSTMLAHLLYGSHLKCTAFLGGIAKNYHTNLLLDAQSPYTVIEADEYDRSFHQLRPYMSVITSTDPDHLDIYQTEAAYLESYQHYTSLIDPTGVLLMREGIALHPLTQPGVKTYTYGMESGDFRAEHIRIGQGEIVIDFVGPFVRIDNIKLGVPVQINIENGVAAMALAHLNGVTDEEIKQGMESFRGVDRRFDFKLKRPQVVFLTDYAHHPSEIKQSIASIRALYADKKISVIFQPHLYSRTKDFYKEFANSLSLADEVILTEIYPARELPIEGVDSELISRHIIPTVATQICPKEQLPALIQAKPIEVLLMLGAGDIENYAQPLTDILSQR